jgi:hypothetical protein
MVGPVSDRRSLLGAFRAALSRYFDHAVLPPVVPQRQRLLVAAVIGVVAMLFAYHQLTGRGLLASDFEYSLRAAHRLLDGLNPYHDPNAGVDFPYPYDAQFAYPLIAAIIAVPFTPFPSYVAGALFVGLISGLMAYGVTRYGWWRLVIFLSPSYFVAASVANWPPLLVASAFVPLLFPLAIAKPALEAPVMANYPNRRGFVLAAAMVVFSLVVLPSWPLLWLGSLADQHPGKYVPPIIMGPTVLVAFALLWWRHRPARLLVMLSLVPQHAFFYDQLLLWLLPRTLLQSLALSLVGWLAYFSWTLHDPNFDPFLALTPEIPTAAFTAPLFYLPALALVVWQEFQSVRQRRLGLVPDSPETLANAASSL